MDILHFQDTDPYQASNYEPTLEDIESWFMDSGCPCSGSCECWIEHDGICENGFVSWFIKLGLI